jgi:hypothetical protein
MWPTTGATVAAGVVVVVVDGTVVVLLDVDVVGDVVLLDVDVVGDVVLLDVDVVEEVEVVGLTEPPTGGEGTAKTSRMAPRVSAETVAVGTSRRRRTASP